MIDEPEIEEEETQEETQQPAFSDAQMDALRGVITEVVKPLFAQPEPEAEEEEDVNTMSPATEALEIMNLRDQMQDDIIREYPKISVERLGALKARMRTVTNLDEMRKLKTSGAHMAAADAEMMSAIKAGEYVPPELEKLLGERIGGGGVPRPREESKPVMDPTITEEAEYFKRNASRMGLDTEDIDRYAQRHAR